MRTRGGRESPKAQREELFDFTSLEQMLATSDVVIAGTVLDVEPGRVVGSEADPVQLLQLTINVDEILYGDLPTGSAQTILVEESAGSLEGAQETVGIYGSKAGDNGFYFLGWKDGTSYYYLVNSEGRFLIESGRVVASNQLDAWALELEQLTPDQLKERIAQAVRAVEAGDVQPADRLP